MVTNPQLFVIPFLISLTVLKKLGKLSIHIPSLTCILSSSGLHDKEDSGRMGYVEDNILGRGNHLCKDPVTWCVKKRKEGECGQSSENKENHEVCEF